MNTAYIINMQNSLLYNSHKSNRYIYIQNLICFYKYHIMVHILIELLKRIHASFIQKLQLRTQCAKSQYLCQSKHNGPNLCSQKFNLYEATDTASRLYLQCKLSYRHWKFWYVRRIVLTRMRRRRIRRKRGHFAYLAYRW